MNKIFWATKKLVNRFGYDIKKYHSFYDEILVPLRIKTIIDIGANNGAYAVEMRKKFPEAEILSFEPLKTCFNNLNEKMAGDNNFKSWNLGLGDKPELTTINKSSFDQSSSFLPMSETHKKIYPKSKSSTQEQIEIQRLDDVLKDKKNQSPTFIKIDVQGFEDKVIKGGIDTLKNSDIAVIETSFVELYLNQPLFDEICILMSSIGYRYYGDIHKHYEPKSKHLLYQDSIFINTKSKYIIEKLSS